MAPLGSRVGPLLLVAGLSSGATLALCIFYLPTPGPTGQVSEGRATALFAAASSSALRQSHNNVILPAKDLEPRSLQDTMGSHTWVHTMGSHTWGYNGKCVHETREHLFFHDLMQISECEFSRLIFRLLANRFVMFVAVLFNLSWHVVHWWRKAGQHAMNTPLREVSLAVFIFNIFCNPYLPMIVLDNKVIFCGLTLFAEGVAFRVTEWVKSLWLQRLQRKAHQTILRGWQQAQSLAAESEDESQESMITQLEDAKDPDDLSDLKVLNKYQMMSLGLTSTVMLFLCQTLLMAFYMFSITKNRKNWEDFSGLRWFIGVLLCNLAGDKEVAYTFNIKFWLKVLGNQKEMHGAWGEGEAEKPKGGRICLCFPANYHVEAILRMIMSSTVNTFFQRIVYCTAPILLAVEGDPQEFIKDSLAYLFITQFDDLHNSISFLSDLKKRIKIDEHMEFGTCGSVFGAVFGSGYVYEAEQETEAKITAMEKRIQDLERR